MRRLLVLALLLFPASSYASLLSLPPDEASAQIETIVQKKKTDKKTIDELTGALKSQDASIKIKERAAWALGELQAKSATPTLLQAAKHKGLLVRSAALNALMRLRSRDAMPTFIDIAKNDPILSLRQNATIAIGLLQWDKAIQPLVDLSSDPTPEIRGAAALGMAALQSQKNDFSEVLKEMQADQNPYVQERARRAMDVAKRKSGDVLKQLESSDADIRLFAAVYLRQFGNPNHVKAITKARDGESDDEARYELNRALSAIKRRAQNARPKPKTDPKASKAAQ